MAMLHPLPPLRPPPPPPSLPCSPPSNIRFLCHAAVSKHSPSHLSHATPPAVSRPHVSLKRRLAAGERLYGAFFVSFSPVLAEILGWAGYDFVVVDTEHGPGDILAALPVLQVLQSTGTPAIVRIADNDPVLVKKTLDLGPAGIMIPLIQSPEDVRKAVSACRYPPRGIRGAAFPVVRASRYGLDPDYLEKYEDETLIMVQVESTQAVAQIQDIASVEGVDCIQIGPLDMSASAGLLKNPGDPKVKALLHKVEDAILSRDNKLPYLSGFAMPTDPPQALRKRGYHMVAGTVDTGLFRDAALADLKQNKQHF